MITKRLYQWINKMIVSFLINRVKIQHNIICQNINKIIKQI